MNLQRFNIFAGLTPAEVKALLVLGPGSFVMASTIGTINVGLPAVQDEFGVSLSALKWVSIMGAIMMASMSLAFGRIGDIVGRKRIYRLGMFLYCVFSGVAALSPTFVVLLAARVVTAMGVAMSISLGIAIGAASARPERRGQIIGVLASFTAAGQLAGPSLGGFALDLSGWRGVFWANFLVAGTCCLIQWLTLRGEDEKTPQSFDAVGSALMLVGYPALLIRALDGAAAGLDGAFHVVLVRDCGGGHRCILRLGDKGQGAVVPADLLPQPDVLYRHVHARRGLIRAEPGRRCLRRFICRRCCTSPPLTFGLIMMALPVSTLIAGPIGGRLADRYDPRVVAAAGMFVTFLAVLVFARLGTGTAPLLVLVPLALIGFGGGLFRPANQVAVFAGVERVPVRFALGDAAIAGCTSRNAWYDDNDRDYRGAHVGKCRHRAGRGAAVHVYGAAAAVADCGVRVAVGSFGEEAGRAAGAGRSNGAGRRRAGELGAVYVAAARDRPAIGVSQAL